MGEAGGSCFAQPLQQIEIDALLNQGIDDLALIPIVLLKNLFRSLLRSSQWRGMEVQKIQGQSRVHYL